MKTVYLDIDGVLTDFIGDAAELFGFERGNIYCRWEYGTHSLSKYLSVSKKDLWNKIHLEGLEFWRDMTNYADSHKLVCELLNWYNNGDIELYLATAVSPIPFSYVGRLQWIKNQFGSDFDNFIFIKDKYRLAKKDTVLIDDFSKQCDRFIAEGGVGVVYPRPWNTPRKDYRQFLQQPGMLVDTMESILFGEESKQMELFAG